ncbi:MAG: 2-dehydropantoate 2-reductase [Proteobacteria bacterium]|nr:2-dehydropantoate 2-reductase [Pseudomonadota bacterium]
MKILVLGAGAVGGYFGGRLVQAGADVTFLARPKRAELMAREGLRVKSRAGDISQKVRVVTQDQLKPGYDLVILTAKAYDLGSAIDAVAPAVQGECMVLPLLNGMSHLATLDARFGAERVLGGVAYIASTLGPDGTILHLGDAHKIAFGPRDGSARAAAVCRSLESLFAKTQVSHVRSETILQVMWDKWVFLASIAGMTAMMRAAIGDILEADAGERLLLGMLSECVSVAKAEGYPVSDAILATHRKTLTHKGSPATASMMRDTENGGPTEADQILGAMLALARKHSLAAPITEVAYTHMQAYAARRKRETAAA